MAWRSRIGRVVTVLGACSSCALVRALTVAVVAIGALDAVQANAGFVGFNSEDLWRDAAGDWQIDTFESFGDLTSIEELPSLGIHFDLLNDGVHFPHVMDVDTTGGLVHSGENVLVNRDLPQLPGLGAISFRPLVAGTWITAAGYWNTGGDDSTVIRFFDEDDVLIGERALGSNSELFNGGTSDIPVYRVEIDMASLGNGYFSIDDLQVTIAPAPGGVVIFGLAGLLGARCGRCRRCHRRRRRRRFE